MSNEKREAAFNRVNREVRKSNYLLALRTDNDDNFELTLCHENQKDLFKSLIAENSTDFSAFIKIIISDSELDQCGRDLPISTFIKRKIRHSLTKWERKNPEVLKRAVEIPAQLTKVKPEKPTQEEKVEPISETAEVKTKRTSVKQVKKTDDTAG